MWRHAASLFAVWLQQCSAACYPDGHFDSVKFVRDEQDLNSWVTSSTASGVFVFVRWMGSDKSECCHQQAPAWTQVIRAYNDPRVIFGDINLADTTEPDGSSFTVRYFTNSTSVKGVQCPRWTRRALCEEFSEVELLQHCIETVSGQALCRVDDPVGCSQGQRSFLDRWRHKSALELASENERIARILFSQQQAPKVAASLVMRLDLLKPLFRVSRAEAHLDL